MYDVIILGAGAAGFFAAIAAKQTNPKAKVAILEKNAAFLSKVKISGGGRCNVTHYCFEPSELIKNYPRGSRELLGPFHKFGPKQTIDWFKKRGIELKVEQDGRMFPSTNDSQTIIDCLLNEVTNLGIELHLKQKILGIYDQFKVKTDKTTFESKKIILATGSSPQGFDFANSFGHSIINPVPSLFTFNSPDSDIKDLSGISFKSAQIQIKGLPYKQKGSILITHFGFSGPIVLKLSAFAARELFEKNYEFEIEINWLSNQNEKETLLELKNLKNKDPSKNLISENPFQMPKNFWKKIAPNKRMNDLSEKDLQNLVNKIHKDSYLIKGKTTHKEEFVTAGGIFLKEVDFKTLESKIVKGLYFAGEILDIDGITGGFNFQNAWTTGFISGTSAIECL
jgi:predicted Rossmann fold flavoprotein